MVAGLQPAPAPVLSGIACTPLYPIDKNAQVSLGVEPSVNLQATITYGTLDLDRGDVIYVGSGIYTVRFIDNWYWPPTQNYHTRIMVVEND